MWCRSLSRQDRGKGGLARQPAACSGPSGAVDTRPTFEPLPGSSRSWNGRRRASRNSRTSWPWEETPHSARQPRPRCGCRFLSCLSPTASGTCSRGHSASRRTPVGWSSSSSAVRSVASTWAFTPVNGSFCRIGATAFWRTSSAPWSEGAPSRSLPRATKIRAWTCIFKILLGLPGRWDGVMRSHGRRVRVTVDGRAPEDLEVRRRALPLLVLPESLEDLKVRQAEAEVASVIDGGGAVPPLVTEPRVAELPPRS